MRNKLRWLAAGLVVMTVTTAYAVCYFPTWVSCAPVGQYIYNGGVGFRPPGCSIATSALVLAQGWKAAATTADTGQQGYSSTVYNSTIPCRDIYVQIYNNCTGTYDYIYVNSTEGSTVPNSTAAACF